MSILSACSLAVAMSTHLFAGEYTEVHPSARCEIGRAAGFPIQAGAFLNSEGNLSITAGTTLTFGPRDQLWLEVGAATGYSFAPVVPFARAGWEYSPGRSLWVLPTLKPDGESLGFVVGIEYEF